MEFHQVAPIMSICQSIYKIDQFDLTLKGIPMFKGVNTNLIELECSFCVQLVLYHAGWFSKSESTNPWNFDKDGSFAWKQLTLSWGYPQRFQLIRTACIDYNSIPLDFEKSICRKWNQKSPSRRFYCSRIYSIRSKASHKVSKWHRADRSIIGAMHDNSMARKAMLNFYFLELDSESSGLSYFMPKHEI